MPSRLEIVYFSDTEGMGGAEIYLLSLLERLDRSRFQPRLVARDEASLQGWISRARAAGVLVETTDARTRASGLGLQRLFRTHRPDVVHFNLPHPFACRRAIAASRAAGVPVRVATNHLPTLDPRSYSWRGRAVLHAVNTLLDMTIVGSAVNRRWAIDNYLLPADGIITIPYGVSTDRFGPHISGETVRRQLRVSPQTPLVGTVGRLSRQKGHVYLIEAARIVLARHPEALFVIEGEGELREQLASQIRTLGLEGHVILLGTTPSVPEFMAALDVFVLTSIFEGLPLTLLEAMASAKAVVAPAIDGIPDAVEDYVDGRLVPPCAPEATARVILELLDDPALRRRMGQAGRARVERDFDLRRMVNQTEELYLSLLGRKGRPVP